MAAVAAKTADLSSSSPIVSPMSRRPDPLRIYAAHRAGLSQRLQMQARLSEATAERRIASWESEARLRGLDGRTGEWWAPAWDWIATARLGCVRGATQGSLARLQPGRTDE